MNELLTLMTAVFAMVNQVGSYKISPERQKLAEQVHSLQSAYVRPVDDTIPQV